MAEYIELTDLWSVPLDYIIDTCGSSVAQGFIDRVNEIKPADARPVKHGKWIVKTDSEGKTYGVCSCCGYKQYAGHLKYCPECGGKMDGPNQ